MPTPEPSAAYVPRDAKVCRPECRNPDYNECADCWKDGGNPALYPRPASDAAKRQESKAMRLRRLADHVGDDLSEHEKDFLRECADELDLYGRALVRIAELNPEHNIFFPWEAERNA